MAVIIPLFGNVSQTTSKGLVMAGAEVPGRIKLTIDEAHALGEKALRKLGFCSEEAKIVTHHLVDNMMTGYEFAGLPRILTIAGSPDLQKPRRPTTIVH
jgi:hypothetical protein